MSQFTKDWIKKSKKKVNKVGIVDAGSIPHSLLADQDLEPDPDKDLTQKTSDPASDDSLYEIQSQAEIAEESDMTVAEREEQGEEIVYEIQGAQQKRQKAAIKERVGKSFKDYWSQTKK